MVFLIESFSSTSFILVYGQFLWAKGAHTYVIAGVIYMSIEKNSVDGAAY